MYVVIAIYDRKTEGYGPLIQERSLQSAIRAFGDQLLSGKETMVNAHPEDFDLVHFGTFNEMTGELSVHDPSLVINARALLRQLQEKVPSELKDVDRVRSATQDIVEILRDAGARQEGEL